MRMSIPVITIMVILCITIIPAPISDSSEPTTVEQGSYCYGDTVILNHVSGNDDAIWTIEIENGGSWRNLTRAELEGMVKQGVLDDDCTVRGATITLDVSGCDDRIRVEQRIPGGDPEYAIHILIPLHLDANDDDGDGKHIVTFHDGDDREWTYEITKNSPVSVGSPHVYMEEPTKAGWDFAGWYTDPDCTDGNEFDPTQPIRGNMDVYAKWLPGGISLVTFETDDGLTYHVLSSDSNAIRFTVSVKDGYRFDMSTLSVTATSGTLSESGGTYTLSGIVNDTTVTIAADRLYSLEYRLDGVTVSMDGYQALPGLLPEGDVRLTVTVGDGLTNLSIRVLKDGRDITSTAVSGTSIAIHVDGDIEISAVARAPYMASSWWVVVMTVAVVMLSLCIMSMPFKDDIIGWLRRNR